MPLIPIKIDRTSKPPVGTPLRTDGHWSVQGLVGAWVFNGGKGNAVFDSTDGRALTVTGTPNWTPDGLSFAGPIASEYCTGTLPTLGTSANTVVTKIKPSVLANDVYTNYHLLNLGPTGTSDQTKILIVYREAGSGIVTLKCGYWGANQQTTFSFNPGQSYTICDVYDKTNVKLYADGALRYQSSAYSAGNISSGALTIGRYAGGEDFDYLGLVEFFYFYNRALTPEEIRSLSDNPWQVFEPETVWINVAASTLTQHSFRFFNDDGSESAATAKANINTNINLSANDVARIRFLIDAAGDPTGKQFQLEYRKKPSGGSFGPWDIIEQ